MKNRIIEKTFRLLSILFETGRPMTMRELAEAAGLERSANWRIISDLCELGVLRKSGYRSVEPALGMIYWSQASMNGGFFPRPAVEELRRTAAVLKVNCALGGLFNDRMVYFFRGGANGGEPLPWHWPLHESNLALCILGCKHGETALEILAEDVKNSWLPPDKEHAVIESLRKRLEFFAARGYALEESPVHYNIAFPLEYNQTVYALGLYCRKNATSRSTGAMVAEGSRLRNRLIELIRGNQRCPVKN